MQQPRIGLKGKTGGAAFLTVITSREADVIPLAALPIVAQPVSVQPVAT